MTTAILLLWSLWLCIAKIRNLTAYNIKDFELLREFDDAGPIDRNTNEGISCCLICRLIAYRTVLTCLFSYKTDYMEGFSFLGLNQTAKCWKLMWNSSNVRHKQGDGHLESSARVDWGHIFRDWIFRYVCWDQYHWEWKWFFMNMVNEDALVTLPLYQRM